MYQFIYDYLLKKYQDNIKIMYLETDAIMFKITKENFYRDMCEDS